MNKIKTHSDYLKSVFRHKVLIHFLRIFLAVFFVSAWEICAEKGIIDSFIFSSPKRIVKCFIELTKTVFSYAMYGKPFMKHLYALYLL